MDKTERANVEFQTFLLKEIYLKSLVAKSELMNDDEEEAANEDRDSNIPNLSKGQVDTYNDIMTNNLAYKLAKEDVFGFNRVLQKRGPSLWARNKPLISII